MTINEVIFSYFKASGKGKKRYLVMNALKKDHPHVEFLFINFLDDLVPSVGSPMRPEFSYVGEDLISCDNINNVFMP